MDAHFLAESLFKKDKGPVLSNFKGMAVINITPDSFSDGSPSLLESEISQRIQSALQNGAEIIDMGAQSTAPFNNAVTLDEELLRFEKLALNALENELESNFVLSIDTYRPEVFEALYARFMTKKPSLKMIWNDVSGIIDQKTIETLQNCPQADYVFTHNLVKDRDQVNDHMEFVESTTLGEMAKEVMNYFKDGEIKLAKYDLLERTYFDPGFGFAKTLEQNLALLKELWWVIKKFDYEKKWLIGISRKSFLQSIAKEHIQDAGFSHTEMLEHTLIFNWMNQLGKYNLTFRTHRPENLPLAKGIFSKVSLS